MPYIEIKDHDPGLAMEYSAPSYPGPGIYWIERTKYYAIVCNGVVSIICAGSRLIPEFKELPRPEQVIDPIAMLAVALHSGAAEKYVK